MFVGVVLLEAIALRLLQWGSFWRSLLDSFLVNLVTTILGLFLPAGLSAIDMLSFLLPDFSLRSPVVFFLLGAMSVAVEGVLLLWIRRRPAAETWRAALIANVVSYVALGGVLGWLAWKGWF